MSIHRRRRHWATDRCRTLAKQGWLDKAIADETGLPLINVRALTFGIKRHGNEDDEKHQAQDRQGRKGDSGADRAETVSLSEDRSPKEATRRQEDT